MVKSSGQTADRDKATEQRILDAAHSVFLRRGTAGARMHEIAEEAGVNQALLHYYFRSKGLLAEAVFRRAAGELFPAVLGVVSSDLDLEEKVRRVVEVELTHLLERPYLPAYILSEINHDPGRVPQFVSALAGLTPDEIRPRVVDKVRSQIAERVAAGTMAPITAEEFLINLLSLCIFPFAARPLYMAIVGFDEKAFRRFIDKRRVELPLFFLRALRP
ncbi:MAG TPA: TetR/AcrR family transcriptional regulator [Thermoanaerobaculia bacterium]|nr:TetR/AcrR family transcriptional regulator [Thermoanaerobaculia bacterium]